MSKVPKVILLIEKSRAFGRGLLHGIVQYSNLHGPWLFYMEPEISKKSRKHPYDWIKDLQADGIIGYTWDANLVKAIVSLGCPAIIRGLEKTTRNVYCIITTGLRLHGLPSSISWSSDSEDYIVALMI
jgi:hypothetical protein